MSKEIKGMPIDMTRITMHRTMTAKQSNFGYVRVRDDNQGF